MNRSILLLFSLLFLLQQAFSQSTEDRYLWLEDINGTRSMEWVKQHNDATTNAFTKFSDYPTLVAKVQEILDSEDRIAYPSIQGEYVYNFWQDKKNERGIWRRMLLSDYLKNESSWETVLDLDQMSKEEAVRWVFIDVFWLSPQMKRCMLALSPDGGDAVEMREFDTESKQFVAGGFFLKRAQSSVSWKDLNTLYVSTDFGEGTMTTSGYPRIVKLWKRDTPLEQAQILFEGEKNDTGIGPEVIVTKERRYEIITRAKDFYHFDRYLIASTGLKKLEIPDDVELTFLGNQMILSLKSNWSLNGAMFKAGSLVSIDIDSFMRGNREFSLIVAPEPRSSIQSVSATANILLVTKLLNVQSELYQYRIEKGVWKGERVATPKFGTITVRSLDKSSDRYFFSYEGFLTPASLLTTLGDAQNVQTQETLPAFFDASKYEVQQLEVPSRDGVRVPYFVVHRKGMVNNGSNPTLLTGYGGFEVSRTPAYNPTIGKVWLEYGGVYVLGNMRGGGEFGPQWHTSAIKENRQKVYDDFLAIAEDLIQRKITSPPRLAIGGASNGGLLVGAAFTQRPDLFKAVDCANPLLDMKRYNKLHVGASWMGEYGNPDVPAEWAYIGKYSPYQNVQRDVRYPRIYFSASTADDRVHPGHARKMVAKMEDMGHKVFYYETTEGGHMGLTTNRQRAERVALRYSFLLQELK